jgi:hypothetical protein
VLLNNFLPEDNLLWSKHVAAVNNTDILVMLTVLYSLSYKYIVE